MQGKEYWIQCLVLSSFWQFQQNKSKKVKTSSELFILGTDDQHTHFGIKVFFTDWGPIIT